MKGVAPRPDGWERERLEALERENRELRRENEVLRTALAQALGTTSPDSVRPGSDIAASPSARRRRCDRVKAGSGPGSAQVPLTASCSTACTSRLVLMRRMAALRLEMRRSSASIRRADGSCSLNRPALPCPHAGSGLRARRGALLTLPR